MVNARLPTPVCPPGHACKKAPCPCNQTAESAASSCVRQNAELGSAMAQMLRTITAFVGRWFAPREDNYKALLITDLGIER